MDITLTDQEIEGITHYKRPKEQLEALKALGIPAKLRRADNTVCVLRMYVTVPTAAPAAANDEPKLKSSQK